MQHDLWRTEGALDRSKREIDSLKREISRLRDLLAERDSSFAGASVSRGASSARWSPPSRAIERAKDRRRGKDKDTDRDVIRFQQHMANGEIRINGAYIEHRGSALSDSVFERGIHSFSI